MTSKLHVIYEFNYTTKMYKSEKLQNIANVQINYNMLQRTKESNANHKFLKNVIIMVRTIHISSRCKLHISVSLRGSFSKKASLFSCH